MNRVDKYKREKIRVKKIWLGVMLFIFLLCSGLVVSDVSINGMLAEGEKIKIFQVIGVKDSQFEVVLFNNSIKIDLKYIQRDLQSLSDRFSKK